MKAKLAKRIVSLVLCVLMIAILPLDVLGVTMQFQQSSDPTPTILVLGYDNNALYADPEIKNPEKQYPQDLNMTLEYIWYFVTYLAGIRQYDFAETTLTFWPEIVERIEVLRCNHDGTTLYNIGPISRNGEPLSKYEKDEELVGIIAGDLGRMVAEQIGSENTYIFSYDWRLSPLFNAKELNDLVAKVKTDTGSKQVSILSEGMGGIVVSTYLTKYASLNNYADIKNYLTINSAAMGSTLFGDIFTGKIDADPNGMVRYTNQMPDDMIGASIAWLVNHILRKHGDQFKTAMHIDIYLISELRYIYDLFIRNILNTIPGLWAMVPYDTYEEALAFMYPVGDKYEDIHHDLLADLNEYHAIQKLAPDTLIDAKDAGVNIAVLSNYGMQTLPLTDYATVESGDSVVDARYSSYGGYTAFMNNQWVGRGLYKQVCQDGHDHTNRYNNNSISKGYTVDASTCALPENTWFIYGMRKGLWDYDSDSQYYLIDYLLNYDGERTVWDSYYYPQFLRYNRFSKPGVVYNRNQSEAKRFQLKGDVNLDGLVTAADARLALRHSAKLIKLTRSAFANGDLNGDGKITAAEARTILRVAAQLEKFD